MAEDQSGLRISTRRGTVLVARRYRGYATLRHRLREELAAPEPMGDQEPDLGTWLGLRPGGELVDRWCTWGAWLRLVLVAVVVWSRLQPSAWPVSASLTIAILGLFEVDLRRAPAWLSRWPAGAVVARADSLQLRAIRVPHLDRDSAVPWRRVLGLSTHRRWYELDAIPGPVFLRRGRPVTDRIAFAVRKMLEQREAATLTAVSQDMPFRQPGQR